MEGPAVKYGDNWQGPMSFSRHPGYTQ